MSLKIIRIATRESPLALWQAHHVKDALEQHWPDLQVELLPMKTTGDKFLKDRLLTIGGKGAFVKELEEALLDGRADLAVHSMKDVPATFPRGLAITAICERHNPFDAFVSEKYEKLTNLPKGAVVGTASLRRQSQLLAVRRDLQIKTLRGNVNTRLGKLQAGEYDAIILAVAGLERLNMKQRIREIISEEIMLPACGQGALGIECRMEDQFIQEIIAPLNDPITALCVSTERQVSARFGGNCHIPLAVFCRPSSEVQLLLHAKVANADGSTVISTSQSGAFADAKILGDECVETLLANGANELISQSHE